MVESGNHHHESAKGTITITQGDNTIVVFQEDRDAFLNDLDNQPYIYDQPTGAGFGGTIAPFPEKPKKPVTGSVLSMDDILFNMKCIAHGWKRLR